MKGRIVIFLILLFSIQLFAQRMQNRFAYDKSKEKLVEGTIVKIEKVKLNSRGVSSAVMLQVQTKEGIQKVFLGPEWFLDQNKIQLREKMKVKIMGAESEINGEKMLMVREMEMNQNKIRLRDQNGFPEWGGPGGKKRMGRGR